MKPGFGPVNPVELADALHTNYNRVIELLALNDTAIVWDSPTVSEDDIEIHGMNSDINTTNNDKTVMGNEGDHLNQGAPVTEQSATTLKPIGFSFDTKRYHIKSGTTVQILSLHGFVNIIFPLSSIELVVQGGRHRKRRNKSIRRKKSTRKSRRAH